jgi:competence protein ComEC
VTRRALLVISASLAAARERPRHLLLGALVAGLLTGPLGASAAVLACAALAAVAGRPSLAVAAVVVVTAGAVVAVLRLQTLDRTALRPLLGAHVTRRVVLLEPPRRARFGSAALARLSGGRGAGERVLLRLPGRGDTVGPMRDELGPRIATALAERPGSPTDGTAGAPPAGSAPVETGAVLMVEGRLRELAPYESYQRRRGAHATLAARSWRATGVHRGGLPGAIDSIRRRAEHAFDTGLDPPRAALMRGMVLGQDQALTDSVRNDFQRSGLAHLLAASGENVALLVALVVPLLAWAGLGRTGRLVGALVVVGLYVPLAGNGPSIQRAGVMGAAVIAAALVGRPSSRWYALGLAAAATLVLNPRSAGDPGWQLSFAAVVAILLLAPRWRVALIARRVPAPLADAISLTAAATIGTAPIIAHDFGQLSLASLPANIMAAPLVAPITWLGALAGATGQVSMAGAHVLDALASVPLGLLLLVAHVSAAAPVAVLPVRVPSALALVAAYAGLLGLVFAPWHRVRGVVRSVALAVRSDGGGGHERRRRAHPVRSALAVVAAGVIGVALAHPRALASRVAGGGSAAGGGAAAGGAAAGGAAAGAPAGTRGLHVAFLDVGQGDATLIEDRGHAVLVDTGPPDGPILARLRDEGIHRLDLLVTTHPQIDHDGGAAAVLRAYPVGTLLDGDDGRVTPDHRAILAAARADATRILAPDAGEAIRSGPIELDVLWPHREQAALHAGGDPNARAIVAEVHDGGFSMLLTADAESDVTGALDIEPVTALKVAHHGSADPGLPDLLRRLHPRIAVIEVGAHNPYGHPTAQALRALSVVPRVYRTDHDGTVHLDLTGDRMEVTTTG